MLNNKDGNNINFGLSEKEDINTNYLCIKKRLNLQKQKKLLL